MFLNELGKNISNEVSQLNKIATAVGEDVNDINYWKRKIINSKYTYLSDTYIHEYELQIRKKIIKETLKKQKFWGYKSIDSNSYESNKQADTNYDRALPLYKLEEKFKKTDLISECICFNSGMAALNAVITIGKKILNSPLYTYIKYFETQSLIKQITSKSKNFDNKEAYLNSFQNSNFHFVEIPISSNKLDDLKISEIKNKISKNQKNIFILIIDSTLDMQSNEQISTLLNTSTNIIVFKVRSGLKLDQFGLELANLGIVEIYSNLPNKHINFIAEVIRTYRTVAGLSVDYNSYLRLMVINLSEEDRKKYKLKIKNNTNELWNLIRQKRNKYFSLEYKHNLPFIYIKPKSPNFKLVNWIDDLLNKVRDEGGYLPYGTSFGFRHTRLEIINDGKNPLFIRLSPGVFLGKSNEVLLTYMENKICEKYR